MAFENGRIQQLDSNRTMSAFSSSDGAASGHDSDVDSGYSKSIESAEMGSDTAPSTPKTDDVSEDGTSTDDEPLSVFREGVRKRKTARHGDDDEVADTESEDESARQETLRDYSYEGELEMLHVPRMAYPFPSYLRQIASEITSTPESAHQHPLLSSPSSYIACQNLPLYLHRRLPTHTTPTARKRARSLSYESDVDGLSDASMLSSHDDD
ncbi:hypothetical protein SPRG_22070 [Saprolegnia parasitica CBS 223.65]|uniref:Uncharacterized protein n=1 Tax=Saprolegnia parasitica (strain CBS 223.65) TaxID=695850 RepID=A0A067CUI4_SAPPC|nr:hypothetical protein SPRG_22070 [Saprolegnia parasitica CBS 223.65]KDO34158.1 hypothetical protein SPRG_22070 [Saprolegnia parasitica CBS 223.65]|eukprot:XP_012195334.1 hypothetical protein SPRG_22070 [Saprolegnia parasitica CBS 223.65]